jgi:hypothetical protein
VVKTLDLVRIVTRNVTDNKNASRRGSKSRMTPLGMTPFGFISGGHKYAYITMKWRNGEETGARALVRPDFRQQF